MKLKTCSSTLLILALLVPSLAQADKLEDAVTSLTGPFTGYEDIKNQCQEALGIPDEVKRSDAYKTANDRPADLFLWRRCITHVTKNERNKRVILRRDRFRKQFTDTQLNPRAQKQIETNNRRLQISNRNWRKLRALQAGRSRSDINTLLRATRSEERTLIRGAQLINIKARRALRDRRRAAVHYCSGQRGQDQKNCVLNYVETHTEENSN